MPIIAVKDLGKVLPDRIRLLSSLIARKPAELSTEWASTIADSFSLYTRTSTVNLINSTNEILIDVQWPFPSYLDLGEELKLFGEAIRKDADLLAKWRTRNTLLSALFTLGSTHDKDRRVNADVAMVRLFNRSRKKVFEDIAAADSLHGKEQVVKDIRRAYEERLWCAVITTSIPLLDCIMRDYFETDELKVSVQTIRDAFIREAKLRAKDLKPGFSVWNGKQNEHHGNTFARDISEDLRLPGVLLASFLEFAEHFYDWYTNEAQKPKAPLNRHAVMHCASDSWSEANAAKLVTFIHLTVTLAPALRILTQGEEAISRLKKLTED